MRIPIKATARVPIQQAGYISATSVIQAISLLRHAAGPYICLWQKRLEKERFKWPKHLDGDVMMLDGQQLNWLLDGYDLAAMRPHRSLNYRTVL
ncbi:MAG: IS66 family insertion sequence element accessory protein TnpB [Pseudomonadota bacterium]